MAIQDLTIVELLFKQIKNSGEVAILGTQAADSSATGPVLQILMTPKQHCASKITHHLLSLWLLVLCLFSQGILAYCLPTGRGNKTQLG